MAVHERFHGWVTWEKAERDTSQHDLAAKLGCSQAFVSLLASGKKSIAKLPMAHAVERLSSEWPAGPIRTEEWDATATSDDVASEVNAFESVTGISMTDGADAEECAS